jgi:Lar family restriction alleviation protein
MLQNTTLDAELLPCPFCGGEAVFVDDSLLNWKCGTYGAMTAHRNHWVTCIGCFAQTDEYESQSEAARKWNERAP